MSADITQTELPQNRHNPDILEESRRLMSYRRGGEETEYAFTKDKRQNTNKQESVA